MKVTLPHFGFLALLGGLASHPAAHAQCLPLQLLTAGLAEGQSPTPQSLGADLPSSEWQLHKPPTGTAYWVFTGGADASATTTPETRLELRHTNQQTQADVVYKTPSKECFNDLRAELRRAKFKAEPVTCVQCEAERFTAPNYVATVYNQQENFSQGKAPYPFVVVVHPQNAAATPAPAPAPVK